MLVRKFVLPVMAVLGAAAAFVAVAQQAAPIHSQNPVTVSADNPYEGSVSGAGTVEARSENIAVAPAIGGVIKQVYVAWGQQVKAGDQLYQIDELPLRAQTAVQEADVLTKQAAVAQFQSSLERLKNQPRAEDVPIYEAKVQAAEAALADARDQYDRMKQIANSQAMSADDINRRTYALMGAEAAATEARADLAKLKAGAWKEDIAVAEADVKAADAQLAAAQAKLEPLKVDLDRLTVRAPVDGQVLRINVRPGEYAAASGVGSASDASVVLGDVEHLHIRVDIDESDVPRFKATGEAVAFIRGRNDVKIPLKFVRVEPFVLPKRSLTGSNTEQVDTRVLQVIYSFERGDLPLYVGQQMDVFIAAK